MSRTPRFTFLHSAAAQHLADVAGLGAVHGFVRQTGGEWTEALRIGTVDGDQALPALSAFDADRGGHVQGLDKGGWLASYDCSAPGMDMCLLFYVGDVPASALQTRLHQIEAKTGWLLVAALRDIAQTQVDTALSTEIGARVLLDAALARRRNDLADQWIARLEATLKPDMIAVCWVRNDLPNMVALSGGGVIERMSRARHGLEELAAHAIEKRAIQTHRAAPAVAPVLDGVAMPDPTSAAAQDPRVASGLAALEAGSAIVMPIYADDSCRAVVVALWRAGDIALPRPEALDLIARVLGESLAIQARARPSILRRLGAWIGGFWGLIFGRRAGKIKLVGLVLALVILGAAVTDTTARPAFEARIEARDRFVVSAPFDGFLTAAPFQLGDKVSAGTLLIALEETDFQLQLSRTTAEQRRLATEIQTAQSQRDTAKVRSLTAQQDQNQVQLDLLAYQLAQTQLRAPHDGLVVGGDAWRRVGGRVRLGEPLLEIANPGSFSVLAFVDEGWVADLPIGAPATLLLSAFPETPIALRLTQITTDAGSRGGVNTFAAWLAIEPEMRPDTLAPKMLEGMRGIVRIETGQTNALAHYTRGLRRWFDQTLWRWR